jgi:hypothetical protein
MTEQERLLLEKTTDILKKNTSHMKLIDIIGELVRILELKETKS